MKVSMTSASALVVLILVLGGVRAAQEPGTQPKARVDPERQRTILAKVMAKKLHHTQQLIRALALEDFAQLAIDAGELKQLGEESLTKISPNLDYIKYCGEFTSLAEELARRAKDHDLNGSTLSYVKLTINCVECHKYVRDRNIRGRNP